MALTDESDLFCGIHEDGFNLLVRQVMRQRPPLFNYGTAHFAQGVQRRQGLCSRIDVAKDYNGPLITVEDPLPILGCPLPLGLDWCFQLSELAMDFHPGNAIALPAELGVLADHRFALKAKACFGLACPDDRKTEEILEKVEAAVVTLYEERYGLGDDEKKRRKEERDKDREKERERDKDRAEEPGKADPRPREPTVALPFGKLHCFCLSLYVVGNFTWGDVPGSEQPWLKARVDGLEIVDIGPPGLESAMECYLRNVLRFGILPRIMLPMEALVLDITSMSKDLAIYLGKKLLLGPAATSAALPFNPAIESDQLKLFVDIQIV